MPVPKRKTSKSRRDKRQSTKFLRPQAITMCNNCGHPLLPHQACESCGFYKGIKVITTKRDRLVKRGEVRQVQAQRQAQRHEQHNPEGSSPA